MFKIIFVLLLFAYESDECGVPRKAKGTIVHGIEFEHGDYPWMVSLFFKTKKNHMKYICGGTLISENKVLTAAHCLAYTSRTVSPSEITVLLGGHNFTDTFELHRVFKAVKDIKVHYDYNPDPSNFDADIALLTLADEISFNAYIQPICMFNSYEYIHAENGTIVGYGKTEDPTVTNTKVPRTLDIPMHRNEQCFLKFPDLAKYSSPRTYCGGRADGTGACSGDSGHGLFVKHAGNYYLHGIVSSSLMNPDNTCNVLSYSIFTNVQKYKNWINEDKVSSCGLMSDPSGLVQGGKQSTDKQFPWAVRIIKGSSFSTGAIVSKRHAFGSGSYFSKYDSEKRCPLPLDVGLIKISVGNSAEFCDISTITLHPKINNNTGLIVNNVGIVTLAKILEFSDSVRPICLTSQLFDFNRDQYSQLYVAGYGINENQEYSKFRKHQRYSFLDQHACRDIYSSRRIAFDQTKLFCAIGNNENTACSGDSLIFVKINGKWFLRGLSLLSFGLKGLKTCNPVKPHLYEDSALFFDWIDGVISS